MRALQRSSFGSRLRGLRQAKGLSQVDLARLIGRHQTVIGPYERDEYEPPREIVEKLAQLLETSPEYLYFGRSPGRSTVPLVGSIGVLGLLEPASERGERNLALNQEQLLAFQVGDDSMAPVFRPGQLVLAASLEQDPAGQLGRDVLAELRDGRILLRRLLPSADLARYDLAAYNAPLLGGAHVTSTRPVLGVLWPGAVTEPRRPMSEDGTGRSG